MEQDPIRVVEILLDLEDVNVIDIDDPGNEGVQSPFRIHIECQSARPRCPVCHGESYAKGTSLVELIDLPMFGSSVRLIWHKRRWVCRAPNCPAPSWTDADTRIAAPRQKLTDRAAKFAVQAVGKESRSVSSVAEQLGCDWHTVNDAVIAYGTPLV